MKKLFFIIVSIGIIGLIVIYYEFFREDTNYSSNKLVSKGSLTTEHFIINHLLHEDGTIRTNFFDREEGRFALSESMGLWMEYLVEKEDEELFDRAYETVKRKFLLKEGLISWKIENGKRASTNALIDDIRIAETLFTMGERLGHEQYIEDAIQLSNAILTYNKQQEFIIDFYDAQYKYANEELTISYINLDAFIYMEKYDLISRSYLQNIRSFMQHLPQRGIFYPKSYHVIDQTYAYDEIINIIDQLYITLHLERANIQTDSFYDWLKEEFYKEHCLYGRYELDSKKRAVAYESAAVYALAILYTLERNDYSFAKDLYEQLMKMQVQDPDSIYNGGYIEIAKETTHSFDNLLPLLAERKLRNANIIQ